MIKGDSSSNPGRSLARASRNQPAHADGDPGSLDGLRVENISTYVAHNGHRTEPPNNLSPGEREHPVRTVGEGFCQADGWSVFRHRLAVPIRLDERNSDSRGVPKSKSNPPESKGNCREIGFRSGSLGDDSRQAFIRIRPITIHRSRRFPNWVDPRLDGSPIAITGPAIAGPSPTYLQ